MTMLISTAAFSQVVCRWENWEKQPFQTYGYTWGGGEFKTFEECQRVIRITVMALESIFKDFDGELTFIDPKTNEEKTCFLGRVAFPFFPSPEGYDLLVYEAFHGKKSPQDFLPYKSFIDSNFSPYCD